MNFAMMQPTNRHGELIAHLAPERIGLGKAQVMRVGGFAAADQARLARHELAVLLVAQADGLCRKAGSAGSSSAAGGRGRNYAIWFTSLRLTIRQDRLRAPLALPSSWPPVRRLAVAKRHNLCAEACLDQLGVSSRKGVLGGQAALRPNRGRVG